MRTWGAHRGAGERGSSALSCAALRERTMQAFISPEAEEGAARVCLERRDHRGGWDPPSSVRAARRVDKASSSR
eukprot:scaffold318212_cov37-Tisochrysis_lutea.AAC.2